MVVKYKLSDVAKDFNKPSKDIADLLLRFFQEPKKNQSALEGKELDIIFDVLTQENQVESFNEYFAMQKPVEKAEKNPVEKKAEVKKSDDKKAEKTPVQKKSEDKKAENKKAPEKKAESPKEQGAKQNKDNKQNDKKGKQEAPKAPEKKPNQEPNLNPFKKKEKKKDDGPMQSRTKGERVSIEC